MARGEGFYRELAESSGLPFVALDRDEAGDPVDRHAARLIPPELARRLGVIPVAASYDSITLAASRPSADELERLVLALTGRRLELVIAEPEQIRGAQRRVFGAPPVLRTRRFAPPPRRAQDDPAFLRRLAANA